MARNYTEIIKHPEALVFQHYPVTRKSPSSFRILLVAKTEPAGIEHVLLQHDVITVKSFQEAASYLNDAQQGEGNMPDVIAAVSDSRGWKKITDFAGYLSRNEQLSVLPFILLENRAWAIQPELPMRKPVKGIDDVISGDITAEKFLTRITLLKKFKLLKRYQNAPSREHDIPVARRVLHSWDSFFKRMLDILIAAPALLILSPVLLIIAIIIKLDSKGPVFYLSYRAGSNYRIFKFIKFRTMVVEADHKLSKLMDLNQYAASDKKDPVFFKISNDPRITRVGRFLRNTSLDELPQLFNVLKGDMSLVGNRPLPLYEAKTLTTDSHAERFNAPAGITGLWQISKRGQKEMSAEERIALDINYARHNSFLHDFQIMLKTPKALIQKDNV